MKKIVNLLSVSMALSLLLGTTNVEAASSIDKYKINSARICEAHKLTEAEKQEFIATVIAEDSDDGYVLEDVDIFYVPIMEQSVQSLQRDTDSIMAIGDSVYDVTALEECYFPDEPFYSNWYDGPSSSLSLTISGTAKAKFSSNVEVSAKVVKAGVGFDVEASITMSETFVISEIKADERLNVKGFANYKKYGYKVKNIWGEEKGSGYAYNPIGIYISQAKYNKK